MIGKGFIAALLSLAALLSGCAAHPDPIVDMRGEAVTVEYYERLLRELDERIEKGVGALKDERFRVLWDNLPIWFKIGDFSNWLGEHGVNVVASTYTYAWGELAPMIDPANPLDSMARVYLHPILNRSTGHKLETMKKMVAEFELDGVILHSDRSCKPYSLGQIDQRDRLVKTLGVPALLLEAASDRGERDVAATQPLHHPTGRSPCAEHNPCLPLVGG